METGKLRIILDTNIWISFLINNDFAILDAAFKKGKIRFLFSEELIQEFTEVAARPKLRRFFSKKDINRLVENFEDYGEFIPIGSNINVCRDPKDNFLLNLAVDGKADYLVTGDQDLLILEKIGNTEIISLKLFFHIFSGGE